MNKTAILKYANFAAVVSAILNVGAYILTHDSIVTKSAIGLASIAFTIFALCFNFL